MQKLQSNLQNMVIVLTVVAVVCGGLLAFVNLQTKPGRDEAAKNALNAGIEQVLGGKCTVNKTDTVKRNVNNKEQTFIVYKTDKGTAVQSTDPNGFGGNLTVLVGFDKEGTIMGYTILETAETPGLGAKAAQWFQDEKHEGHGGKACIIGKNPGKMNFTVSKDGGDVDAITASTITSRAFLRAVMEAYNTYNNAGDSKSAATKQCDKACCDSTKCNKAAATAKTENTATAKTEKAATAKKNAKPAKTKK